MQNKRLVKTISVLSVLYILYFISSLFNSDFWGNILSPAIALFCFSINIYNAIDAKNDTITTNKYVWAALSFSCLFWALADIAWAYYHFFTAINPDDVSLIESLYYIPNLFLFFTVGIYLASRLRKWNNIQLLLDTIYITVSIMILLWFMHSNNSIYKAIMQDGFITVTTFALDLMIIMTILTYFLSVKLNTIPVYFKFIGLGIITYTIIDLIYFHIYIIGSYIPNSIIDFIYITSFILFTIGGIIKKYLPGSVDYGVEYISSGFSKSGYILLVFPVLIVLMKNINNFVLFYYIMIIFTHRILSFYIQASVKTEHLLKKEKEINSILEQKINERTKEIMAKNLELEKKNKELDYLSNKDTFTNLYNRRFFIDQLDNLFKTIDCDEKIAVFYIDVDRFKTINDMYGHQVGDMALIELSKRLEIFNCNNYISARLGGDEFVLACYGPVDYNNIEKAAGTLIKECCKPIEIGEYQFYVSASIGIAIYPSDATDSTALMKNADIAMYEAKSQGKNRYVFFDSKFEDSLSRKNTIENLLKKADLNKEFQLYYQPQFSIDKQLIGAEALLRWNSSPIGFISPAEFIPIAEEIDYINLIGEWVIKNAIIQVGKWNKKYSTDIKIGINISPKQLDNKNLVSSIEKCMKSNSVPPKYIDIEITESIAIEGEYRINQIESLFSSLGLSISIDDFGTGYSSLSYLKIFPFERIKIAKPLIDVISTDSFDYHIVKAVIKLAKSIGIKTIAEGVEFKEQYDILAELGCDEIQGYYLGKPMPAEQFEKTFFTNCCIDTSQAI